MINDQYFSLEANLMADDSIKRLIEVHGQEGWGIYITLLLELRKQKGYRCNQVTLRYLARTYQIEMTKIESIIHDFKLFKVRSNDKDLIITSPYLNRVMKRLEEKRKKQSIAGKKSGELTKRADNGRFTSLPGTEEKSKVKESKEEKSNINSTIIELNEKIAANNRINKFPLPWELHLKEAVKDREWVNLLGARSGLGRLFTDNWEEIVEAFRHHIHLFGTGNGIRSVKDIKFYFTSFLTPGSKTFKTLVNRLRLLHVQRFQKSPYRFEEVDKVTGERSYYGNPIPSDAPPRPHTTANWSNSQKKWV